MVCKDVVAVRATHAYVAFESSTSFRKKLWPGYKANRTPKVDKYRSLGLKGTDAETMASAFYDALKATLKAAGVGYISVDGMEADDVLASGAVCLSKAGHTVVISTRDKDLMQVVRDKDNISLLWPQEKLPQDRHVDEARVFKLKGVKASQMASYQAMIGDKIDDIHGLPRFDAKAKKLLNQFKTIEEAVRKSKKWREEIWPHIGQLKLNAKLVKMNLECWQPELKTLRLTSKINPEVKELFASLPKSFIELSYIVGNQVKPKHSLFDKPHKKGKR